ncbi:neutral zinc metallopeptidase [Planomonospora venezuelensis]|uniref:Metalloprotease n=1 Tax=Planomonospora venezuelensis TaxID=1999 RepID=A0A841D9Q5_PLAVE|nr:neutral zinc metallopeptidase [Planomonospora venezuelensis]MBB5966921.1 hypothetical protein [Planomonospora venezuelensis]
MRMRMIAALTGLAGLLLSGTAHAYPIKDEMLTKNKLYSSGRLAAAACKEPPVKDGDAASLKKYWAGINTCLDTVWGAHLTKAGLPFSKPVLKFGKIPKKYCDFEIVKDDSMAYYCPQSKTIMAQLGKNWLEDTDDLWLLHLAGGMYGYHVMNLVGIEEAFQAAPYANKNELNEQIRRQSLQTDCLGGVFVKSVWSSLRRPGEDWKHLLGLLQTSGDVKGKPRTAGKGGNRVYWTKKGYVTGNPASCNTWSAPSSKVA